MKRSAAVVALFLAAVAVRAADQPKDKKDKDKKTAAPAAVDPLADADAKIAAGDLDGAAEALTRAAAAPGATGEQEEDAERRKSQ